MPQPAPSFADELRRVSAALDRLIADVELGPPFQSRHDEHVDRASALGDRLQAAGRGPIRASAAPLRVVGNQGWW